MDKLKFSNILTKKILYQEYIKNKKSTAKIARIFKVSDKTVSRYLKINNIKVRPAKPYGKFEKITKKSLSYLYLIKKYTISKIAKKLGCTGQNIWERMIRFDIPRRSLSEAKKGHFNPMFRKFRELHPRYIKNLNREYPKEFNDFLKEKIRKRDNFTCQGCGLKQKDHYRKLDVHHKNGNKNDLRLRNLISLCQSCHVTLTNIERYKHKKRGEQLGK